MPSSHFRNEWISKTEDRGMRDGERQRSFVCSLMHKWRSNREPEIAASSGAHISRVEMESTPYCKRTDYSCRGQQNRTIEKCVCVYVYVMHTCKHTCRYVWLILKTGLVLPFYLLCSWGLVLDGIVHLIYSTCLYPVLRRCLKGDIK